MSLGSNRTGYSHIALSHTAGDGIFVHSLHIATVECIPESLSPAILDFEYAESPYGNMQRDTQGYSPNIRVSSKKVLFYYYVLFYD
jgi:hypothetical protein